MTLKRLGLAVAIALLCDCATSTKTDPPGAGPGHSADTTSRGADWVPMWKEEAGTEAYVDISRITRDHAIGRAWFKVDYAYETKQGRKQHAKTWLTGSSEKLAFNCADSTFRVEQQAFFFEDRTTDVTPNLPGPWRLVELNGYAAPALKFVCAWGIR